jgi:predicted transcriptional regulator
MSKPAVLLAATTVLFAQDLNKRFDEIAKERADTRQFMGNVLIAKGEQVLFEKSDGSANLEWRSPIHQKANSASVP